MHTSPQEKPTTQTRTLYMALELSATTWKLGFWDCLGRRPRLRSIPAGQMTVPEVRAILRHLLDLRQWGVDEIVAWSNWRTERNRVA